MGKKTLHRQLETLFQSVAHNDSATASDRHNTSSTEEKEGCQYLKRNGEVQKFRKKKVEERELERAGKVCQERNISEPGWIEEFGVNGEFDILSGLCFVITSDFREKALQQVLVARTADKRHLALIDNLDCLEGQILQQLPVPLWVFGELEESLMGLAADSVHCLLAGTKDLETRLVDFVGGATLGRKVQQN